MLKPIIYRVMRRLDDNSLVSPYTVPPFLEVSLTPNGIHQVIPYGFGSDSLDKMLRIMNGGHPLIHGKFEVWIVNYEKFVPLMKEFHPYQLYNECKEHKTIISECLFNADFNKMPLKIGQVLAPSSTIFCRNISLCEKVA